MNQNEKVSDARSAHRFLVKGLVGIAFLAIAMGFVVGWLRPIPLVPSDRPSGRPNIGQQ